MKWLAAEGLWIIKHIWEFSLDTITNAAEVYINYLRHKVDQDFKKKLIHTMPGVGCQLGGERSRMRRAELAQVQPEGMHDSAGMIMRARLCCWATSWTGRS